MIKTSNPEKEMTLFMWGSVICSVIAVLIFPFMAIAAIPLATRAGILTFDKRIKGDYYIPRARAVLLMSVASSTVMLFLR